MTTGCVFFGHFGRDPEAKTSKNGTPYTAKVSTLWKLLCWRDARRVEETYGRGVRDFFGAEVLVALVGFDALASSTAAVPVP